MDSSHDIAASTEGEPVIDPSHPIVRQLWPLGPDAPPQRRLDAVFAAYSEATGIPLSDPKSADKLHRVGQWLHREDFNMPVDDNGHSVALLYAKRPRSKPLVAADLADKVAWLQQAACTTCISANLLPRTISFSIRVRPFSTQSLKTTKIGRLKLADLKNKIAASMTRRKLDVSAWDGCGLCVTVVVITAGREKLKDVDNMVKGLLDALHGSVYDNDQRIQHVSVHRVVHGGGEGWYSLQVKPVLDAREDVVDPVLRVGWPGQEEIVAEVP